MYKSNSGLGIYSNRFCIKLSILLSKRKEHLMRYCSYTKRWQHAEKTSELSTKHRNIINN
jgi:hypothetical protein